MSRMSPTYMPRGRSGRGQASDLFRAAAARDSRVVPVAERMRPRTLDEVVGQRHILGPNTLLREVVLRALRDEDRGLGRSGLHASDAFLDHVVRHSSGDARRALNALEVAAARAQAEKRTELTEKDAEEALQQKTLLYDKSGDAHYDTISAFIKSLRGSDPDAAVYYLVRMLESGEEPRFLLRRMVIFASEDVGNADPRALSVAVDALRAFELVGLPEGVLPMTQAAAFLASCPKSNSTLKAYSSARQAVLEKGALPIESPQRRVELFRERRVGCVIPGQSMRDG